MFTRQSSGGRTTLSISAGSLATAGLSGFPYSAYDMFVYVCLYYHINVTFRRCVGGLRVEGFRFSGLIYTRIDVLSA